MKAGVRCRGSRSGNVYDTVVTAGGEEVHTKAADTRNDASQDCRCVGLHSSRTYMLRSQERSHSPEGAASSPALLRQDPLDTLVS